MTKDGWRHTEDWPYYIRKRHNQPWEMSMLDEKGNEIKHFNKLLPESAEALALIAEECAEVIQAIAKIQRHGFYSEHPVSGIPNWTTLHREVGDLLAALRIGEVNQVIDWGNVIRARDSKLMKVSRYLHHAKVTADAT
jgi:NTP pyrophosphatase (non-canonical NTP hydrolase)